MILSRFCLTTKSLPAPPADVSPGLEHPRGALQEPHRPRRKRLDPAVRRVRGVGPDPRAALLGRRPVGRAVRQAHLLPVGHRGAVPGPRPPDGAGSDVRRGREPDGQGPDEGQLLAGRVERADHDPPELRGDAVPVRRARVLHLLRNRPHAVDRVLDHPLAVLVVRPAVPPGALPRRAAGLHLLCELQARQCGVCLQRQLVRDLSVPVDLPAGVRGPQLRRGRGSGPLRVRRRDRGPLRRRARAVRWV